ncbi:MAG: hypothetical protein JF610_07330 [Acidobacteria bacterium]|nr:hypothetical protein [Acidobacteriota bacterium]
MLSTTFGLILGTDRAAASSLTGHWLVVYTCVPLVVVLSFATFKLIEAPAMASVDRAMR